MYERSMCPVLICLLVIALGAAPAGAEWLENGYPACVETHSQSDVQIVSDGSGGVIIGWRDNRNGNYDIFAMKLDAYGNPVWGPIDVCSYSQTQMNLHMASDGLGGAVFVWEDSRSGTNQDIYAQRIDSDGDAIWAVNGVGVCTNSADQFYPKIARDNDGGAVIAWQDYRNGGWDIFAQRVHNSGSTVFTPDGVAVCTMANQQQDVEIATDGHNGMIVLWNDFRSGTMNELYAQRVDYIGNPLWAPNGVLVCSTGWPPFEHKIVDDGVGGVIMTWHDSRTGFSDIYAQRIGTSGSIEWTVNGVPVTTTSSASTNHSMATDGLGGSFVVWADTRPGDYRVYAQKLDISGNALWTADGIRVCTVDYLQNFPRVVSDGTGGAVIAWNDYRYDNSDVFAQRLNQNGQPMWDADGVALCVLMGNQPYIEAASDCAGGAIAIWSDFRNGNYDIFAQRAERNGYWGYPAAHIASLEDIPGDQGGYVNIAFDASRLDPWPDELISEYTVWRAIGGAGLALLPVGGACFIDDLSALDTGSDKPVVRIERLAGETYYWQLVSTIEAYHLESYAAMVETAYDSTGAGTGYHYFQVIAHTSNPSEYWISSPDSGYSVDDLAPCPPLEAAAEQLIVPAGLEITWKPNTEADLDGYVIHRSDVSDFIPDGGNLVYSSCDTVYFDSEWRWDSPYWYKLAAIDVHGNVSEYVLLGPNDVTGDETPATPMASFLSQNYPNPFNPATTIRFGVKESGHVSLRIYDVNGRLVRVLVDERREPGRYEERWDGLDDASRETASGIFFYRLVAGSFEETKKMVLLR
jgi:hypothetical protein